MTPTRYPGIYQRGSRYVVRFRDAQGVARKRSAATRSPVTVVDRVSR